MSVQEKIFEYCGFKFVDRGERFFRFVLDENIHKDVYRLDLKPDDIVLDIGACIGTFAIPASAKARFVVAFEPEERNYKQLVQNIMLNNRTNISANRFAVVGTDWHDRTLWVNMSENFGRHSFFLSKSVVDGRDLKISKSPVSVPCLNINDMISYYHPTVIKCDGEGIETEIFFNIRDYSGIREISFEYHFDKVPEPKETYWLLIEFLRGKGFEVDMDRKKIDKLVINQVAVAFVRCKRK